MSAIQTFTSFTTSNCYVVTPENNSDICYIIDLPPDVEPALEYVKNNNLSIGGCLLTHGHFDHSLGMEKVDGKIYINLDDEFLARNPQEQLSAFTNSELEVQEYTGELNDIFLFENENIDIFSNPGHTKGSISYEFKNMIFAIILLDAVPDYSRLCASGVRCVGRGNGVLSLPGRHGVHCCFY